MRLHQQVGRVQVPVVLALPQTEHEPARELLLADRARDMQQCLINGRVRVRDEQHRAATAVQLGGKAAERHRLPGARRPPNKSEVAAEGRTNRLTLLLVQHVMLERDALPGWLDEAEQPVSGGVRCVTDLLQPTNQRPK
jgi:hypothetical protein